MTIRLYDSRQQTLVDFVPLVPGQVVLYVCGPTVQSSPHIGHLRSALVYDLWRRWFTYRGLDVTLVRNVTDIDDKILALAADTTEEWWARAYRYELEFTAGYQALGRQADAVVAYERCRRRLGDVLGVTPSAETERLHRSLRGTGEGRRLARA